MLQHVRFYIGLVLLTAVSLACQAHNNPTFREDLLLTVPVAAQPAVGAHGYSEPFAIDWPKNTVQLIWRIVEPAAQGARFAVAQDDATQVEELTHDKASARLQGEGFTIVDVHGADGPFTLELYAKILDRSLQKKP